MEHSEQISDHFDQNYHRSSSSSNGDPDPAISDLVLAVVDVDDRGIPEKFASLEVNDDTEEEASNSELDEKEEPGEARVTVEKDLKESEDEARNSGSEEKDDEGEEASAKDLRSESENDLEGDDQKNEVSNGGSSPEKKDEKGGARRYQFPVRPEAEDCSFYLKTGTCKFGSNCKFNHPTRRKSNYHHHNPNPNQVSKERTKEAEESLERPGQSECKFYLRSGGCKYGKACKYNHRREGKMTPAVVPVSEFNFLGLPIRVGEKECPYYMRTGSCKYGVHCRFNHPDPTGATGSDTATGYGNGGPVSLQSTMPSWSSPNESVPPPASYGQMMVPPAPMIPSPNTEWNGYQAHAYISPDLNQPPAPVYGMNNSMVETNVYNLPEGYPERPGQPDCTYFLKTGDCKFRFNCKYHHPKNRASMKPQFSLSDKGLPLRPDQNICTHFSRYGICKYGPACKYDHSPATPSLGVSGVDNLPNYGHSAIAEEERSEVIVQHL